MRILLRLLVTLVLFVVLVVVAAGIYLSVFFDPNDYKAQLAAQVEQQTGRSLTIGGDIELSVFPWVALGVRDVSLSNAQGFEEPVFAAAERMRIAVKLLPMLQREVVMDRVTLEGLVLNLARNAEGRTNWEDLAQPAPEEPQPDAGPGEGMRLAGLAVGGVEVTDANVSWRDAQAGQSVAVQDLRLATGAIEPGQPLDFELAFTVELGEPAMTAQVSAETVLVLDVGAQRYSARDLRMEATLTGDTLPASPLVAELAASVDADLQAQTAVVENLLVEALGLELEGSVEATQVLDAPAYTGSLRLAQFSPRDLVERLGMPPVETADAGALQAASLDARFEGTATAVTLQPLTVRLDDTTLEGQAGIADFAGPAYRFDLLVDAIDMDRYLPPAGEGEAAEAPAPQGDAPAQGGTPAAAALAPLRALDLEGRLRVGELQASGLSVQDVEVRVEGKDGLVNVDPLSARLYEGSLQGKARLDARTDPAKTTVEQSLTGVQVGPLLKDLAGDDTLTGRTELSSDLSMTGLDPEAIKKSLDGTIRFAFMDGSVKGINIPRLIRQARARLEGKTLPPEKEVLRTDFSELTGSARITDGLVNNDDLLLKSPLLRVEGEGQASLPQETIDYRLTTTIVGTLTGQGGEELQELEGVPIPVQIGGTFQKPSFKLDLAEVLETRAAEEVKKRAREEVEKKVQEKLGDKLKEGVGGQAEEAIRGLFR